MWTDALYLTQMSILAMGLAETMWVHLMIRGHAIKKALALSPKPTGSPKSSARKLITFSHFLPKRGLHRGYGWLQHFEGSHALGAQIDALRKCSGHSACTHVFGHTHFSMDVHLDGVRFVQQPLGNPDERRNRWQIQGDGEYWQPAVVWARKA